MAKKKYFTEEQDCTVCKMTKRTIKNFYYRKDKDIYLATCKECMSEYNKKLHSRLQKNPEYKKRLKNNRKIFNDKRRIKKYGRIHKLCITCKCSTKLRIKNGMDIS